HSSGYAGCKHTKRHIIQTEYLFKSFDSDSKVFLERVKVLPVIVLDGKVGHISFTENTHEVAMKTFVDFYAISKASRVIRILAPEMYNTVFSYYAAVLGGIIPEELHV
ncbi:hypothetical protein, partial [Parabacteroides merdae]|uniref:hypothetical protein n=1 Tax=Parabacteroides merdae TaxID=46503 RepID=UPI00232E93E2